MSQPENEPRLSYRGILSLVIGLVITALAFGVAFGGHSLADQIQSERLNGVVTFIADLGGLMLFPGALFGALALDPHGVRFMVFTGVGDVILYSLLAYRVLGRRAAKTKPFDHEGLY